MHFCILGGGVGLKGVLHVKGGIDRLAVVVVGGGGIREVALIRVLPNGREKLQSSWDVFPHSTRISALFD